MSEEVAQTVPEVVAPAVSTEADNTAAAIAILAKARADKEPEAEPAAPVAELIPDSAKAEPPKAVEPAKTEPDQAAVLLQRLNQLEATHRQTAAENKSLKDADTRAKKWDNAAKAAAEGDISTVATELGWTPEAILKYIDSGKDGVKDVVADKKVSAVETRIAQLEQQLAVKQAEADIRDYKSTIVKEVSALSSDTPYLVNDYTDPDTGVTDHQGIADAIFALQHACHFDKSNPRDISTADAAKLLNKVREGQLKRLQGKTATSPKPADAATSPTATPAKKPEPVAQKPRVSLPAATAEDSDLQDALATLKSLRLKRQAEAPDASDLD